MSVPQPINMDDFNRLVCDYIESEYDGIAGAFDDLSVKQKMTVNRIVKTYFDPYDYDVVGAAGNIVDYLRKIR